MKKLIFGILMLFGITLGFSQEKGFHLTLGGGLGLQSFDYDIGEDGSRGSKIGYGAEIGARYYFTRNIGVGVGLGFSRYSTSSKYDNALFEYNGLVDSYDGRSYDSRITLMNWKESQITYFLDIPVMFLWQKKFDKKEAFGMYFGAGLKFQIPIESTYKVKRGSLNLSAYFPDFNINFGDEIDIKEKGLGDDDKLRPSGDNDLKLGMSLAGELGFLVTLSPRIDLMLGISADYGLLNIKKKTDNKLASPVEDYTLENVAPGENIDYRGVLNTSEIGSIHPFSVKGNVGLKIKLGKLRDKELEQEEAAQVLEKQDPQLDAIEESLKKLVELMENQEKRGRDTTIVVVNPGVEQPIRKSYADEDLGDQRVVNEQVFFDLNSAELRVASKITLDKKVSQMNRYPDLRIRVIGNTCDLGSERINMPLGLRRAESVKRYMIEKGINGNRIMITTSSDFAPLIPNTSEENRALNRRVDFEVIHE